MGFLKGMMQGGATTVEERMAATMDRGRWLQGQFLAFLAQKRQILMGKMAQSGGGDAGQADPWLANMPGGQG